MAAPPEPRRRRSGSAAWRRTGLAVGVILAYGVVMLQAASGKAYYWQIMLPGGILGLIVGYATQRHAERSAGAAA